MYIVNIQHMFNIMNCFFASKCIGKEKENLQTCIIHYKPDFCRNNQGMNKKLTQKVIVKLLMEREIEYIGIIFSKQGFGCDRRLYKL